MSIDNAYLFFGDLNVARVLNSRKEINETTGVHQVTFVILCTNELINYYGL